MASERRIHVTQLLALYVHPEHFGINLHLLLRHLQLTTPELYARITLTVEPDLMATEILVIER